MHVIGTAGHVDHGKSTLVSALTGTNPDRWLEERLRGMTLDLGFAHLRFPDGIEAGIVDVPGHERFLHNMLAGAAGMEMLLLVVAADEGVMPQTLEHLEIVQYLNVRRTIVVVTKADRIDANALPSAVASIERDLRGTLAEGAAAIAVSATNGSGMEALRAAIHRQLRELDARSAEAPAYMPLDRAFAVAGHGTVVTGTLLQGTIAVGDALAVFPHARPARVRSLQVFGEPRQRATAGSRVAVNLPGYETRDVKRGDVLAATQFVAHDAFAVTLRPRAGHAARFRRRTLVRAYVGSAEILGTIVLDAPLAENASAPAKLFLREPVAVYPEMPYVLRAMSPKTMLGGGTIRASLEETATELPRQATSNEALVLAALAGRRIPASAADIARAANLREEAVSTALERLLVDGAVTLVRRPDAYLDTGTSDTMLSEIATRLAAMLEAEPWSMGVTSLALARASALDEGLLVRLLAAWVEDGRLANHAGYYAPPEYSPQLTADQMRFFEENVPVDASLPLAPVALDGVVASVKASRLPGTAKAFDTLLARGALVKVGDAMYRGTQIAQIHARLEAFLRERERMTMAEFRDLIQTSRKFAVPLLEWFDARGITVRAGDYRSLRATSSKERTAGPTA